MAKGIHISEEFYRKFGKKYPAETFICQEGDPGKTMFVINTGKIAIIKGTVGGEKLLATLGDGDFFGEMALMGLQERRSASAKTLVETNILELTAEAFEALIRRSPELAMTIIKSLCERVRDSNAKVSAFAHKTDAARISSYVNSFIEDNGVPAPAGSPGKMAVLKPEFVAAGLGVPLKKVQTFFELAHKTRLIGRSGDWVWVPYGSYLVPLGEYLSTKPVGL
jgi:CRP/FNR family cyclic AMP-dependent transcriptional regulator